MSTTFPGTTIEVSSLQKGSSRRLFDGIFATGGVTLSQVSIMSGLEPYIIQNWVKRGFLSSPVKRLYSKGQFARIIIINMLRESLQLERICGLISIISGVTDSEADDLISDEELYHRYIDMLSERDISVNDERSVLLAAERATEDFEERFPNSKKQLIKILQVMLYAHAASGLRRSAEDILCAMK
ncbi:MAG: DUF1836 domain-containing protein [Ruminococcaceae bacterium]|nr:DUF1836 domain-containing protein [Oscillospiraceae bacterium]